MKNNNHIPVAKSKKKTVWRGAFFVNSALKI